MKNPILNLNIACGDTFVVNDNWINLDYESNDKNVTKCDILNELPFKENSISNIYSSHFIEHIPLDQIDLFLKNCFKVLVNKGIIRIVTPDFYEMVSSYIKATNENDMELTEFVKIEILDQLVRTREGGRLRVAFNNFIKKDNNKMIDSVRQRLGLDLRQIKKKTNLIKKTNYLRIAKIKFFNSYTKLILRLLPKAFRNQNVSLAKVGETHKWLWDYNDIKKRLEKAGFSNIIKKKFNESNIKNFPYELDQIGDIPRKGNQSMFIEAEKI